MQLILLENIQNLGKLGDVVQVKPGYGRNYLVPQGKAVEATEQNRRDFEQRRAELEARAVQRASAAGARREVLHGQTVTITANASSEGKLYGSVGPREIALAMTEAGYAIDKSEVILPEGPFRLAGEYEVDLHLLADVDCTIKVIIVGEES